VNPEELKEYKNIDLDERVGKSGIEKFYEKLLHGSKGVVMQVVDARGKTLKEAEEKPVEKGKNLYLTIDIDLQKKVEDIIKDHRGSAIIINPKNGEILALASNPSFDPNIFSKLIPDSEWDELNNQRAFFNIPIQGTYPPGSTFKALISLFGLESKIINSQSKYVCTGALNIKGLEEKYKCWVYPSSHGAINLKEALKQSCDIFFYLLAKSFDINLFERFAVTYGGLTEKTGIDLSFEESGFLGSPDWKKKYVGYPWYDGDSMNLGIGQGYLSVTPMQMVKIYSKIANNGVNITPHLLLKTDDNKGFYDFYPLSNKEIYSVKEENIRLVRQDLVSVTEPGGTAYGLNFDNIKVAAKTGTAEGTTGVHLWLISIVPADNPEIVALVMFENSTKQLASELVPYLKQILQYYFKGG
jgi:penicillin-binding protein 2